MPKTLERMLLSALFVCVFATAGTEPVVASVKTEQVKAKSAERPKKKARLCVKAYVVRRAVIKKLGRRAPGRNICRFGMSKDREATTRQKARYLRTLRRLNAPAPAYLVRTAVLPRQKPAGTLTPSVAAGGTLSAIAQCESGNNPSTNTGNGFYGKYQFTLSTWQSVGGSGNPASASEAEQDRRAAMLYAREGAAPWPVCGR